MPAIYGLISTRNNVIRYIGKTEGTIDERFSAHSLDAQKDYARVYRWMRLERWCGFDIVPAQLDECPVSELDRSERRWISTLPNLVNERGYLGYRFALNHVDRKRVEEIRSWEWPFEENWDGWTSVRYYPSSSRLTLRPNAGRSRPIAITPRYRRADRSSSS